MSHVLEHLVAPERVLAAIREVLAPAGLLVVRVPNLECLLFHLLGKHYIELYPDVHLFHFTRSTLHRILSRQGYTVQEIRTRQCDFAPESFVLVKGFLDALRIYERVKPPESTPTTVAQSRRSRARSLLAPLYPLTYPLWAVTARLGLGYELFAVARTTQSK
jgi:hypothetical protein